MQHQGELSGGYGPRFPLRKRMACRVAARPSVGDGLNVDALIGTLDVLPLQLRAFLTFSEPALATWRLLSGRFVARL